MRNVLTEKRTRTYSGRSSHDTAATCPCSAGLIQEVRTQRLWFIRTGLEWHRCKISISAPTPMYINPPCRDFLGKLMGFLWTHKFPLKKSRNMTIEGKGLMNGRDFSTWYTGIRKNGLYNIMLSLSHCTRTENGTWINDLSSHFCNLPGPNV